MKIATVQFGDGVLYEGVDYPVLDHQLLAKGRQQAEVYSEVKACGLFFLRPLVIHVK